MNHLIYNCQACEDPKQGESVGNVEQWRAMNNTPKYAHLCQKHYERLTDEQKRDYAMTPFPQWKQETERFLSVMLFRFRALRWFKPEAVLYLDTDSVIVRHGEPWARPADFSKP